MLDPVSRTIEVPCNREIAFRIFVDDMNLWWPKKYSVSGLRGGLCKKIHIDPKEGGEITELGHDDTIHLWGTVATYRPPELFSMHFHMGRPPPESASLVEVVFTQIDDDKTKVELVQSNWEAFGEDAERMQGGYGSAWIPIFEEAYKAACS